jgi:hypothetical protein
MSGLVLIGGLVALVIAAVLFLVLRAVVWWYFGIERALTTLERIEARLAVLAPDQAMPPPLTRSIETMRPAGIQTPRNEPAGPAALS